jgi:hypothetical protein
MYGHTSDKLWPCFLALALLLCWLDSSGTVEIPFWIVAFGPILLWILIDLIIFLVIKKRKVIEKDE